MRISPSDDQLRAEPAGLARASGGRRSRGALRCLIENGHGALERLLNDAGLSCRSPAAMMMVVMMHASSATTLAGRHALQPLGSLRRLPSLRPLRGLKASGLRGLTELIGKVVQNLGLGTTRLACGVLKTRGDLGCHRLELSRILLRKLLHIA